MIVKESLSLSYNYTYWQKNELLLQTKDGDRIKYENKAIDRVEINVESWQANSTAYKIIEIIDQYYSKSKFNKSRTDLGKFYVIAKKSVNKFFDRLKKNNFKNRDLIKSTHSQTLKELKDWYHNGGKPREKVNLITANFKTLNIKEEKLTIIKNNIKEKLEQ